MRKLGWIFFSIAWIPFIGIFIGMAGLPQGSYDWIELPILSRVSMIVSGGLMGVSMLLLFGSMLFTGIENRSVLAHGQDADATILKVEPTGETVNNFYYGMSFLLEVKPSLLSPFQARAEKLVPMNMVSQYPVGATIKVKFDPQSKAVAIFDEKAAAPSTSAQR